MRPLTWPIRALALVQLLLALPLMASGSICIPLDGAGLPEPGFCVCTVASAAGVEESIDAVGADECGPCRDVAFRSLKSAGRVTPGAPTMIAFSALPGLTATSPLVAIADPACSSKPPGGRLSILRC
jgi:hypothetical protein